MAFNTRDYDIVIPIEAKDNTAKGASSALSNLDKMALQAARASDQRALSAQNSHQRMIEAQMKAEQQLLRDRERYAQQAAMANRRYAEQAGKEAARFAQQRARDEERYASQAARDRLRIAQAADREQRRLYEQQVKAFERAERERVRAAEKADRDVVASRRAAIRQVEQAGQGAQRFGQGVSTAGMITTAAVTAPMVGIATEAVMKAASLDSLTRALRAVSKDEDELKKKLLELREVAKLPGLGFPEAVQGQVRLQAVGMKADLATESLRQFGNAIALTGGGRDELARVTVQLAQMSSKGKVLMQDLRPIIEASPAVATAIKKAFGSVDTEDINKQVKNSSEFIERLVAELAKLPRVVGGIGNDFENFADTMDTTFAKVGARLIPVVSLVLGFFSDKLPKAVDTVLAWFDKLPPGMQKAVGGLLAFVAAVGPTLLVVGGLIAALGGIVAGAGALVGAIGSAAAAVGGLGPLLAVVVAGAIALAAQFAVVAGVVTTVGATIYAVWSSNMLGVRDSAMQIWGELKDGSAELWSFLKGLWFENSDAIKMYVGAAWLAIRNTAMTATASVMRVALDAFGAILSWTKENWPLIRRTIEVELRAAALMVKTVVGMIQTYWAVFGPYVVSVASNTWAAIRAIFSGGMQVVGGIVKLGMAVLNGEWSKAGAAMLDIARGLTTGLRGVFGAILRLFYDFGPRIYVEALTLGQQIIERILAGITGSNAVGRVGAALVGSIMPGLLLARAVAGEQGAAAGAAFSVEFNRSLRDATAGTGAGFGGGWTDEAIDKRSVDAATKQAQAAADAREAAAAAAKAGGGKKGGGGKKSSVDELDSFRKIIEELDQSYRQIGESTDEFATKSRFLEAVLGKLKGAARDAVAEIARKRGVDDAIAEGITKLNPKIQEQVRSIYSRSVAQAKDNEIKKLAQGLQDDLNKQLLETRHRLVELERPLDENATEVAKFDLAIAKARESSTEMARVLAVNEKQLAAVRGEWEKVDAAVKERAWHKDVAEGIRAVEEIADRAKADLASFGADSSTALDRVIDGFSKLKGLDLARSDFGVLRSVATTLKDMPGPERLTAIATAIDLILTARKGRLTADEFDKLRLAMLAAADAATKLDEATVKHDAQTAYDKLLGQINEKLVDNNGLTELARVQKELETEAYKNLTAAQRESLYVRAAEVDQAMALKREQEALAAEMKQVWTGIENVVSSTLGNLVKGDIAGFVKSVKDAFRNLWQSIVLDFLRSGIMALFRQLLGGGGGPGAAGGATGAGSNSGGILGILRGIFSGGSGAGSVATATIGGFAGGNPVAAILNRFIGGGSGPSITAPAAASGAAPGGGLLHELGHIFDPSSAGASAASGGRFAGLAASAPLLGLMAGAGIGASLGKGFTGPTILGAAGLGLAGWIGAGIAPGLIAGTATLSALGFALFGVGIAAAVGAYLWARKKQRDADEKKRTELGGEVYKDTITVLNKARSDGYSSVEEALADFDRIKTSYYASVSQLKDKKTRGIAEKWFAQDFEPFYRPLIVQAAQDAMDRAKTIGRMNPEFAAGGFNSTSRVIRVAPGEGIHLPGTSRVHVVPGQFKGYDSVHMWAPVGTQVFSRADMQRSPGFLGGGVVEADTGGASGGSRRPLQLTIVINEDDTATAYGPEFENAVVQVIRKKKKSRGIQ